MSCHRPVIAWENGRKANGKVNLIFKNPRPEATPITLPCGSCVGCMLNRKRNWALRCYHEAQQFHDNCFVTLTFEEEPDDLSLDHKEWQRFMYRLRKKMGPTRFFMAGEYGRCKDPNTHIYYPEYHGRAHYHAILFGTSFPEREVAGKSKTGHEMYTSPQLDALWPGGIATVQDFHPATAAYVAGYTTKKLQNPAQRSNQKIDFRTGEVIEVKPEYTAQSTKPGIGYRWYKQYAQSDMYNKDFTTIDGYTFRPPAYYDKLFEIDHPAEMEEIKQARLDVQKEAVEKIMNGDVTTQGYFKRLETLEKIKLLEQQRNQQRD